MKIEHTPLPWFMAESKNGDLPDGTLIIAGDEKYKQDGVVCDGNIICAVAPPYRTTEIDVRNAEYIVEACNNYYTIRTQLYRLERIARDTIGADGALITACDNARAVLNGMKAVRDLNQKLAIAKKALEKIADDTVCMPIIGGKSDREIAQDALDELNVQT